MQRSKDIDQAKQNGTVTNGSAFDCYVRTMRVTSHQTPKIAYELLQQRIANQQKISNPSFSKKRILHILTPIAASILILIIVKWLLPSEKLELNNVNNHTATLMLPDQSRIVLSQNSEVKYFESPFNRKIQLTGEAYFEINKGKKLTVETSLGNITVLGTRFLVTANHRILQTTCYEGIVRVNSNFQPHNELLEYGNSIEISATQAMRTKVENSHPEQAYFSRHYFNEVPQVVLTDMENFFGVQIEFQSQQEHHFSGTFYTPKINEALDIICLSLGFNWHFKTNNKHQIIIHS
jgi:transmembrane sensor